MPVRLLAAVGWVSLLLSLGSFLLFAWLTIRRVLQRMTGPPPAPPSGVPPLAPPPSTAAAEAPSFPAPPPVVPYPSPVDLAAVFEALCALVASIVFLGLAVLCASLLR